MTRIIEGTRKNQIFSFDYKSFISVIKPVTEILKPKSKKKKIFLVNQKDKKCFEK